MYMAQPFNRLLCRLMPIFILILMLTTPQVALKGASDGLVLWATVVLPTLLPFMLCSQMIVATGGVSLITAPLAPVFCRMLRLSEAGAFVMATGLLCGYPMGAKTSGDFVQEQRIPLWEGKYLMALANHPSPMFLLGYVLPLASWPKAALPLLLSLYLPLLVLAPLAYRCYCPAGKPQKASLLPEQPRTAALDLSFDDRFMACLETMIKIGGYIMLFSMLSTYLQQLTALPVPVQAWLLGMTEITTGVRTISLLLPPGPALACLSAACAWGGLSGIYQTGSVIKNTGLSIRHYLFWKLLHSIIAAALAVILLGLLPALQ